MSAIEREKGRDNEKKNEKHPQSDYFTQVV